MREQQARKPVYSSPVQIFANHTLIAPVITAVEQPILASALQVNRRSRAEVEHRHLSDKLFGPMRMFNVEMSAGNLREQVDHADHQRSERPVRIIKNNSMPRQQRRRKERKER